MALILVIDDEPDNRALFSRILRYAGHTTLEAINGAIGLELAAAHRPDLILMDLAMPVLDGWQTTIRLKAQPGAAADSGDRADRAGGAAGQR